MRTFVNTSVRRDGAYAGLFSADEYRDVESFYAERPTLASSPLRTLPALASSLGLGTILVKDESARFGLEAFKVVGVTYAMHTLARERVARGVVCATAGNHGRAVARAARNAGVPCTVFVPSPSPSASEQELAVRSSRVNAMRNDRARVVEVTGTYEAAVARAVSHARDHETVLMSDTAPTETDAIARSIMLGYTHILSEASTQWSAPPDVVLVQGGVGGLVAAAASWFAFHHGARRPTLIACEPDTADCLLESARAGCPVDLTSMGDGQGAMGHGQGAMGHGQGAMGHGQGAMGHGTWAMGHGQEVMGQGRGARGDAAIGTGVRDGRKDTLLTTIMAGLRCATPSAAAWPAVRDGIDAFVAIPDSATIQAIDRLARPAADDPAIISGPSGACGVGALLSLCTGTQSALAELGRFDQSTTVMAIVTEGA